MNAKQFFSKVVEVRNAQKTYFRHRSQENLVKSKMLEKELDDEIMRVQRLRQDTDIPLLLY